MPQKPRSLIYRDQKYGFILSIPRWWKPYYVIRKQKHLYGRSVYSVVFKFKYKGKIHGDICDVSVFRMTRKKWENYYQGSYLIFLAESNGLVFALSTPGEPPSEFYNDNGEKIKKYEVPLRLLERMINKDVPRIIKTFRVLKKVRTVP